MSKTVNRTEFEKAMKAALSGPELKGYSIIKHDFNVKPVRRKTDGAGALLVEGQLSHRLRWSDDDQLHYKFRVVTGQRVTLDQVEIKIDRSFVHKVAKFVAKVLWEWFKEKLEDKVDFSTQALASRPDTAKDRIFEEAKPLLDGGKWEDAANFLIVNVAGRLAIGEAQAAVLKQTTPTRPKPPIGVPTKPRVPVEKRPGKVIPGDRRSTP